MNGILPADVSNHPAILLCILKGSKDWSMFSTFLANLSRVHSPVLKQPLLPAKCTYSYIKYPQRIVAHVYYPSAHESKGRKIFMSSKPI